MNMTFETIKELIFCYGWAVIAMVVVAVILYDYDNHTEVQIIDVKDYAIEEWDFNVYSTHIGEPCFEICMLNLENDSDTDEGYDYCIERCIYEEVSFYKDSYCNITCDDGASFRLDLGMPEGMVIPAQVFVIDNNDSLADCSAVCYGLFIGFGSK